MRNIIASIAAAGVALGLAAHAAAGPSSAGPAPAVKAVAISDYSFKPATLTIPAGTKVVWTNKDDDPHTVTADDGAFDSKGLGQGDSYSRIFAKAGRWTYHCSAHPFMKGVVVVTKGSGS
jgi:plastocyanin